MLGSIASQGRGGKAIVGPFVAVCMNRQKELGANYMVLLCVSAVRVCVRMQSAQRREAGILIKYDNVVHTPYEDGW
jgi:hypothetical protein